MLVKETEGEGYVSGDYECWCIHPVPFDEWKELDARTELSVYPSDFFPPDLFWSDVEAYGDSAEPAEECMDYSRKVKYRVRVEVEYAEIEELTAHVVCCCAFKASQP